MPEESTKKSLSYFNKAVFLKNKFRIFSLSVSEKPDKLTDLCDAAVNHRTGTDLLALSDNFRCRLVFTTNIN